MADKKRGTKRGTKENNTEMNSSPLINTESSIDQKKEELESLRKRMCELESEISKKETESKKEPEEVHEKPEAKKSGTKALVILIIILLIVDLGSLYFYYKPDLSGFFKFNSTNSVNDEEEDNATKKCNDGTSYGSCSKNKPYYCYNGELLKKAATCGCPSGSKVDFQDCKKV